MCVFCRLKFPEPVSKAGKKRPHPETESAVSRIIEVKPYTIPNRGPYPYNVPKKWAPTPTHPHTLTPSHMAQYTFTTIPTPPSIALHIFHTSSRPPPTHILRAPPQEHSAVHAHSSGGSAQWYAARTHDGSGSSWDWENWCGRANHLKPLS